MEFTSKLALLFIFINAPSLTAASRSENMGSFQIFLFHLFFHPSY
jgi:hypothetical protein